MFQTIASKIKFVVSKRYRIYDSSLALKLVSKLLQIMISVVLLMHL